MASTFSNFILKSLPSSVIQVGLGGTQSFPFPGTTFRRFVGTLNMWPVRNRVAVADKTYTGPADHKTMQRLQFEYICEDERISPDEAMIRNLEHQVGYPLPEEYRTFLQYYSGTAFDGWLECPLPAKRDTKKTVYLDVFFGFYKPDPEGGNAYHIPELVEVYKGRIPEYLMPIADHPAGSKFCICLHGKERGAVFYWDFELELSTKSATTKVNSSFTGFLDSLHPKCYD